METKKSLYWWVGLNVLLPISPLLFLFLKIVLNPDEFTLLSNLNISKFIFIFGRPDFLFLTITASVATGYDLVNAINYIKKIEEKNKHFPILLLIFLLLLLLAIYFFVDFLLSDFRGTLNTNNYLIIFCLGVVMLIISLLIELCLL